MEFTEAKKKELEQSIVDICISALENKGVTEEQMGDVSFFVLERIDLVKNQQELLGFLEKLSEKWPIFVGLLEITRGEAEAVEDKKTVINVQDLIKQGNLDQAIAVAKEANGGGK